ncbi:MAG: PhzF family phenazine biosynthesis protein [Saprospiraceae bacterium]
MKQTIPMYQVDAFTDRVFSGNPAAVCILDSWLESETMQQIAAENNLAETAFVVRENTDYAIRWFTPVTEVDLCGHATLATARILFSYYPPGSDEIRFQSVNSGILMVTREADSLTLNFPADTFESVSPPPGLIEAMGSQPEAVFKGKTDYLLVYKTQQGIQDLKPDFVQLRAVNARGVIATAPGTDVDFVSRFFAPQCGIDEDPVTGSAHTTLVPYWHSVTGKENLTARQISSRGGFLNCSIKGDRVYLNGQSVVYLKGEIEL